MSAASEALSAASAVDLEACGRGSLVKARRTNGVTAWPGCRLPAVSSASSISAETSTCGSGRVTTIAAPPSAQRGPRQAGNLFRRVGADRRRRAAFGDVEERHRYPYGSRAARRASPGFDGGRHVEQRLRARADDDRGRAGELARSAETSGRVAAVNAADAAGGEDRNRGETAGCERRPDCRRANRAVDDAGGEIRGLTLRASSPQRRRARAARRRDPRSAPSSTATVAGTAPPSRTRCSHSRPTASPRPAEAVRHDRRLQGDDRPHCGECLLNVG